jgi:thioredoxin:protein disulfide reductase
MTGGGGWPMSVFLTPDRRPFRAGTYLPRDRFMALLKAVRAAWEGRRAEVVQAAASIEQAIALMQTTPGEERRDHPDEDLLGPAVAALARTYDREHGGFGSAPKFPPHGALALLLRAAQERGDKQALEMAVATLEGMARGGLYDQVGGGFHRYATDAAWRVPHFEKMLYDNALLVPLYLMAWAESGRGEFRLVAEETLEWMRREMIGPSGGFCATLDADSEGEEGRYYTWTYDEIRAVVGGDAGSRLAEYLGANPGGDLPGGRCVLRAPVGDARFAARHDMKIGDWRAEFDRGRAALLAARARRPRPHRNDSILTAWNGLAISAFAVAHRATGRPEHLEMARRTARFALANLVDRNGATLVSWRAGRPGGAGFLYDTALLMKGLLDLNAADGDRAWVDAAVALARDATRFTDERGGFYFADRRDDLIVRPQGLNDEALPSGNAVMVENLARLSRLRGDVGMLREATRILDRAATVMRSHPGSYPYMILARDTARAATQAPSSATPAVATAQAGAAASGLVGTALAAEPVAGGRAGSGAAPPAAGAGGEAIRGTIIGRANRERVVEASWSDPAETVRPGASAKAEVRLVIKPGWHINSSKPSLEYLIPTRLVAAGEGGAFLARVEYPEGHLVKLAFAEENLSVYEGEVTLRPHVGAPRAAAEGTIPVVTRLTYQACSDKACLPPETVEFKSVLRVAGTPVEESAAESATATADGAPAEAGGPAGGTTEGGASRQALRVAGSDQISVLMRERGLLFVLGVVFLSGLALCLTPCVYPMIPITLGYFSQQAAEGGWGRRLTLPSLYVLGMAITYSVLGVIAGLTGGLFGAALQNPWVVGVMILLFVAMALWMFGVYELRLPGALTRLGAGRAGALGAFVMGLTLGLVAAPCIGPFIVTLLAFVGASGNPVIGFWLFFVLALGMGLPFLVLGAFSSMLAGLPRSGAWLIYAKKVMGVGLLGVALYFAQTFLPDRVLGSAAIVLAVGAALWLGILEPTRMKSAWFMPARLAVGVLALGLGLWLALPLVRHRPEPAWQSYTEEAFARARADGRPIVLDFFAVWCAPCRELDRNTYSDPRVLGALDRFALFKADLTDDDSALVQELRERYDVYGVPTVVFLDDAGREQADLRLTGFEPPEPFLDRLKRVR